ncbi:MAG: A/G-specific adenine glycosylase [Anaerolineae bacterium]
MTLTDEQRAYLDALRAEAQTSLLHWFAAHARDLPWRHDRTPYRIWVSEVMLQQTQVETVRDYFLRFLARFPTVEALAAASQEEVLKVWEGLGYYRRARMLHAAAQEIVAHHGGELPADVKALRSLPGIGPYTAGAIASLAFDIAAPAVDGNVRRVLARALALTDPTRAELEDAVRALLPQARPGAFNEALMELGATLCRPQQPHCLLCPWREFCRARQLGRQEDFPAPRERKEIPHYDVAAAVTVRDGEVLIARRPSEAMLGGLWEFPGGKREDGETLPTALRREMQEELGIAVDVGAPLLTLEHAYTHFRITLHAFWCRLTGGEPRCIACTDFAWVTPDALDNYAMAVTDRQIAERVRAQFENNVLSTSAYTT